MLDAANSSLSGKLNSLVTNTTSNDNRTILEWAFQHSSDGMLVTDLQGLIQQVNDAFCRMFEYSREEVYGLRTTFLKSDYSTPEFYRDMWQSLQRTGEWKGEIVNRTKTGRNVPCFLTITPIISNLGVRLGYLGVEIDLTERRKLEEQVLQAEKLASIGEAVATLAHEIRNPLNGISMSAQMLARAQKMRAANPETTGASLDEEDRELIEIISGEAKRLQRIVTNVLEFARMTPVDDSRVSIRDLIEEAILLMEPDAKTQNVAVEQSTDLQDSTVRCDPDMIKQVLLNLLRNAIDAASGVSDARYSEPGAKPRVLISVRHVFDEDTHRGEHRVLEISILNTGTPISEAEQQKLFKPFFTTKPTGLGLGLATSLKIVRQHHGSLTVRSPLDEREWPFTTSFTIALPA